MTEAEVRLRLPAWAENIAVVRQALGGLANVLGLDGTLVDDMKLAVTEACTNVVLHAYEEPGGPLQVEMAPAVESLTVTVSDRGQGIRPRLDPGSTSALGLGLPLMAALTDDFEVHAGSEGGTVVRMTFLLDRPVSPGHPLGAES